MRYQPDTTEEEFYNLLSWLDADREKAALRYERIRQSIIKICSWRGFSNPEELADETIIRVTRKVKDLSSYYVGDPEPYFYSVANKVLKEAQKESSKQVALADQANLVAPLDDSSEREFLFQILDECLSELKPEDLKLIKEYYAFDRPIKDQQRRRIAAKQGISLPALRMRVARLRATLKKCAKKKLAKRQTRDAL